MALVVGPQWRADGGVGALVLLRHGQSELVLGRLVEVEDGRGRVGEEVLAGDIKAGRCKRRVGVRRERVLDREVR